MNYSEKTPEEGSTQSSSNANTSNDAKKRELKEMLQTELKSMKCRMRCVFLFLHFTRNSIKWRSQYYYSFIFLMLDKSDCSHWNELPEAIVTPWESAKYSFDQMYSLIKAWASHPDTLTSLLMNHSHPQGQDFIGDMLKNLTDKIGDNKTAIEQLKKALDGSIINDAKNREYQAKAAELLDILQSIVQSKSEKRE